MSTLRSMEADASAAADGWQSVQLPYAHGQLTAYALLPPAGAKTCTVPNTATLFALLDTSHGAATVAMPKFHLTQTNQLLKVLTGRDSSPVATTRGSAPALT